MDWPHFFSDDLKRDELYFDLSAVSDAFVVFLIKIEDSLSIKKVILQQ